MGRRGFVLVVSAALLLLLGRVGAEIYAEFQWFAALDALDAWRLQRGHASTLRLLAFVAGTTLALANLWAVRRSVASVVLPRRIGNLEIGEELPPRYLSLGTLLLALCVGIAFTIPARDWQLLALARAGVPFGESDPYFQADLGIWVFWFPFERALHRWSVVLVATITVLVALGYALTPSLRWGRAEVHLSPWVRRHLSVLGGALLILLAWSYRLQAFDLLLTGTGASGVFGATDHQLGLPISTVLAYTCFAAAVVIVWAGWSGQPRLAVSVLTLVLLLVPALRWGVPAIVALSTPASDAAAQERPYDAVRAGFTRRAYGIDRLRPLPESLTIRSRDELIGMPVWDPDPLDRAIGRRHRHGGLIGAPGVATVGGSPALLRVAAPALASDSTQPEDQWSVLRVRAAESDARGGPIFVGAEDRADVVEQRLRPVLVWDGASGSQLVRGTPRAVAGIPLDRALVRVATAWSEQDPRLLSRHAPDTRLVSQRSVRARVATLVPFLRQGSVVSPLVMGDSLIWVLDLYAGSNAFPLARPLATREGPLRYVAHAATALVSAHSGRVIIVPVADPDPILRAWARLLPRTLAPAPALPTAIAERLPPLLDAAEWQAEAFAAVGTRGEAAVRRHIPPHDGADTVVGGRYQRAAWWPASPAGATTIPLVDSTDVVAGVIVAVGGPSRGVHWHRAAAAAGWSETLDSLRSAGADGASAIAGAARVVPMLDGGWAVVQPFYRWPTDDAPTLATVVVRDAGGTRRGGDLATALGVPAPVAPTAAAAPSDLTDRARSLYAAMRAALQRGDWVGFGEAMNALGALLDRPRR